MSDGVFIPFVCQVLNLVIQIEVCQRFVCAYGLQSSILMRSARGLSVVFVDSPHNSNEDHMELDFLISLPM